MSDQPTSPSVTPRIYHMAFTEPECSRMFVFSTKRPQTCRSQRVSVSLPDEVKLYLNVNSKNANKNVWKEKKEENMSTNVSQQE